MDEIKKWLEEISQHHNEITALLTLIRAKAPTMELPEYIYDKTSLVGEDEYEKIFQHIKDECEIQDDKWGKNRKMSGYIWHAILSEEVGEVAESLLKEQHWYKTKVELIQCAAVAINFILSIDHWRAQQKKNTVHSIKEK